MFSQRYLIYRDYGHVFQTSKTGYLILLHRPPLPSRGGRSSCSSRPGLSRSVSALGLAPLSSSAPQRHPPLEGPLLASPDATHSQVLRLPEAPASGGRRHRSPPVEGVVGGVNHRREPGGSPRWVGARVLDRFTGSEPVPGTLGKGLGEGTVPKVRA